MPQKEAVLIYKTSSHGVKVGSHKRVLFVDAYLTSLNATQAARDAGYPERSAKQRGHWLLQQPDVKAAIQAAMDERAKRTAITADRVLEELAKVAFANMLDYITVQEDGTAYLDLSQLTRDQAAAVAQFDAEQLGVEETDRGPRFVRKVRVKLADKLGALDKLARHLGMYVDKVEHTGKDGEPIGVVILPPVNRDES